MAQKPNWPGFLADARPLTAFRLSPDKVVSGVSQRDSLARKGKVEICKIGIRMLHHLSQRHQTSNSKKHDSLPQKSEYWGLSQSHTHLSEHHRTLEKQMHYHSGCLRILQNLHNTLEKKNYDPLLFAILPPLTLPFQTSNQLQSISPITNKWGHGTRTSIFKGIQLYAWKCYCKELHPFELCPNANIFIPESISQQVDDKKGGFKIPRL